MEKDMRLELGLKMRGQNNHSDADLEYDPSDYNIIYQ